MDNELDKILSAYVVQDADDSLMARIMVNVEQRPHTEKPARLTAVARAAMWVAIAVFGFWIGNGQAPVYRASSDTLAYMNNMIVGPSDVNEIQL